MSYSGVKDTPEVRHAQVRRILESRTFRNTEVLKRLLDYLARQNHTDELKEYTIGVEAFGKPPDYDPQLDSSVRVQIGKLRLKLDEYYRTEATPDEVLLDLPKGQFRLEFHPHKRPAGQFEQSARPWGRWLWVLVAAALVLAGVTASWVYREHRPQPLERWTPDMQALWQPFLAGSRPILIALGTPLFAKIGNDFFRDPSLNTWEAASKSQSLPAVERALAMEPVSPAFPYTGIGEAESAFELERLLLPRGRDLGVRASTSIAWEDITRNNMIFLGPPKYNQQTLDLPIAQDFEISHSRVQNLHSTAGEPRSFDEKWDLTRTHLEEGHALISRLPGLHQIGVMLILAGSSTESTRAAAEYVTSPQYVSAFVHRMRERGGIPQWFQAVIRARYRSQTPIAIELVAIHELKQQ
jgi:hypothetical protein